MERRRCWGAGLGEEAGFAPKPELTTRMITRFLDAGHHASWVAGDEVYGGNPTRRAALEERGTGYVPAVACSHEVTTRAGKFRADTLVKKLPKRAWQKLSAGAGAKGHRFCDWAAIDLPHPATGSRQLLIRRNRTTGELAYYRCHSPAPVPLATLVRVAGSRWRVEGTRGQRRREGSAASVRPSARLRRTRQLHTVCPRRARAATHAATRMTFQVTAKYGPCESASVLNR